MNDSKSTLSQLFKYKLLGRIMHSSSILKLSNLHLKTRKKTRKKKKNNIPTYIFLYRP